MSNTNAVTVIQKLSSPILAQAESITIETDKDLTNATEVLSKLNTFIDRVTEEKEKVTKPLNEALKAERNRWKPLETAYETAIGKLRSLISTYQTAKVAKARAEEASIAARTKAGKGNLSLEAAAKRMDAIERPVEAVETAAGSLQFREVEVFEVSDLTKLPTEYLLPNEVKIRKAMLAGVHLPGVTYRTEQQPVNRR